MLATPRRTTPNRARHAKGAALIEVLSAMLVFTLGILALLGLQTSLMRAQSDAKIRSDAAYLATELVGKMWSDLTNITAYNGDGCAAQARCKEWQDKVATNLPSGTGAVTIDGNNDVEITLTWTPPGGDTHTYETHTSIIKAGN